MTAAACPAADPPPADFALRLARGGPSLRARLRRREAPRRARVAGLLALLVAILAWGPLGLAGAVVEPATARAAGSRLLPFEQPGQSFPGSAFYYLAPDSGVVSATPASAALVAPPAGAQPLDAALGDAVARPVTLAGTATDRLRALQCLTAAVYYEAATEPDAGQRAVAQVVLNRVAHPAYPKSVCGVVYQGSERPGCQFTFACDGSMARLPARAWWLRARSVAEDALSGAVYAPVGLALNYHTSAVHPVWADRLAFIGTIGAHRFYRWSGAAGQRAAFSGAYLGGEPVPGPHPRVWTPADPAASDPLALAAAFEAARVEAVRQASAFAPAPAAASAAATAAPAAPDRLPAASAIREEYRDSGKWIAQPGG
ncbi:cell wall hydrolase [Novosphingobium tardum]|uniref:Cell wall hydrolase n=1 Tax=Novosphingobium tardum TaxID=1538021 RepID=A0ABV8RSZ7_9SPHN